MIEKLDLIRIEATKALDQSRRGELGQFMTPTNIAQFMASLFPKNSKPVSLLEAGAGVGSLIAAFLETVLYDTRKDSNIIVTAYEIDSLLINYLSENLQSYKRLFAKKGLSMSTEIISKDFILDAVSISKKKFTHAILNPPYKKIHSLSDHRLALRKMGQEHVNLYSAFVGVSLDLLDKKGHLVAIIPRSFCNGLYYKPFRNFILNNAAIRHLHLFESRNQAFKDDDVLQENIIIHLEKGGKQGLVTISKSKDSRLHDIETVKVPFTSIVKEGDKEMFIHITDENEPKQFNEKINCTLEELGLQVSTGPVVDFRMKSHLRMKPEKGTMPLLYASHFNGSSVDWPKETKKPNAIVINPETIKASIPNGYYTIVKRFSSKEEKQRIVARVLNPNAFKTKYLGLENHLNFFHHNKQGIDENLAFGLAAYLNTSFVDRAFRSFNGHTQVNATDLRQMKYPSRKALVKIGAWSKKIKLFTPEHLDEKVMQSL